MTSALVLAAARPRLLQDVMNRASPGVDRRCDGGKSVSIGVDGDVDDQLI